MNAAHVHLLVNHFPIVGTVLAIPLLLLALLLPRERGLWLGGLLVLGLSGVAAVVADRTGEPAEEMIEDVVPFDEYAMEEHEERAEVATVFSVATLILAGAVFAIGRRRDVVPLPLVAAPLVAAIVGAGLMAWTGAAGGRIRHEEIRPEGAAAPTHGTDADEAGAH